MLGIMIGTPDLLVMCLGFVILIVIGIKVARKNVDSDAFFMAGRKMPGWAVGFSIMAALVSSLTFLAIPAASYAGNWVWLGQCVIYPVCIFMAFIWFLPFFRKGHVRSAYEYMEHRFGLWARLYVAFGFVISQLFRTSIIFYTISIPMRTMFELNPVHVILIFGTGIYAGINCRSCSHKHRHKDKAGNPNR